MTTRKIRFKKLNTKTLLPVLREDQLDSTEYEALTTEAQIQTGVEQAEENEVHLQSILKTTGVSSDQEIPVPPPQESSIRYEVLYSRCSYNMTTKDDEFLTSYNKGKPATLNLSEDDFERLIEVFEKTATFQAPFAAIDNIIIPYDAMMGGLRDLEDDRLMVFAKDLYEYWRGVRQDMGNKPIHSTLKFETQQETDDMDPYVCFRRREVRQTRKTRNRDIQSGDKLRRLRRELEEAQQLLHLARDLETKKQELLILDRLVFEKRATLKQTKIKLGIQTGDEDLINQKTQKRKPVEQHPTRPPPVQLRMPVTRQEARALEQDMLLLSDRLAEKEKELRNDIITKVRNHQKWNEEHVDLTKQPLSPVRPNGLDGGYRPAKMQFLLTPPASDAESGEFAAGGVEEDATEFDSTHPSMGFSQPEFRLRVGRCNRMWIDRRGVPNGDRRLDNCGSDRWKYDSDSDDDVDVIEMDPFDTRALKFRATIPLSSFHFPGARRAANFQQSGLQTRPGPPQLTQGQTQSGAQGVS